MRSYIDYVYYRISKLYYKYDGGLGIYAMIIISLTEGLLTLDLFIFLSRFLFTAQHLQDSKLIGLMIVIVSILPFLVINYINYIIPKGKYDVLDSRWKSQSRLEKTLNGLLIVITLLVPWLLLIPLNTYLQHW